MPNLPTKWGDFFSNNKDLVMSKFAKHACQNCGCERKAVETVIDDEFIWDENLKEYIPNGFLDDFIHTGNETCVECGEKWTGK